MSDKVASNPSKEPRLRLNRKVFNSECDHQHTLVVTSAGVRRTVCESCGNVSFKMVKTTATSQESPRESKMTRAAGL